MMFMFLSAAASSLQVKATDINQIDLINFMKVSLM